MEKLTRRETEIFKMIAKGMTSKAIAKELFISVHTIYKHREHINTKLGFHSVADLILYSVKN